MLPGFKTAYFYWDGEMPYLNALTLKSFAKFNPDWKIVLWVGENVSYREDVNYSALLPTLEVREAASLGFSTSIPAIQSDLCKWWSLANEGGLASDMDILYIKPIPDYVCEPEIGMIEYGNGKTKRPIWTVGFMSGGPNETYKRCFDYALGNMGRKYQSAGVRVLKQLCPKGVTFFDSDIVYPLYKHLKMRHFGNATMIQYEIDFELPDVTIGYHWYGGGKASGKKARTIGPDYNEKNIVRRCMDAIL